MERGVFSLRLSKAERAEIEAAARRDERVLADWIRVTLLRVARQDADKRTRGRR